MAFAKNANTAQENVRTLAMRSSLWRSKRAAAGAL
jgi:hypothetical protein